MNNLNVKKINNLQILSKTYKWTPTIGGGGQLKNPSFSEYLTSQNH